MTVKRTKVKACCGSTAFVFTTDKPIKKLHLQAFKDAGYSCPNNFSISGVFYVCIGALIATTSYGATNINVRCHGANCVALMDSFANLLDKTISSG